MEPKKKKTVLFIIIAIIVVVMLAVITIMIIGRGTKNNTSTTAVAPGSSGSGADGAASSSFVTLAPAPANVVVPNMGATSTGGIAVPTVETAAAPGVSAKYRSFAITVQNGQFSPPMIAVHVGDMVNLQIISVGGSYDFTQPDLGFHVVLPRGQTKTVAFTPMVSGKYLFYCSSCGGPTKGPVGYVVVAQ